jgi:hypothetical protein
MTVKTHRLTYTKDVQDNLGWLLEGFESTYDAVPHSGRRGPGFTIAHDILEHNPENHEVSAAVELRALGAALFGRVGEWIDPKGYGGWENDLITMLEELVGLKESQFPPLPPVESAPIEDELEETLQIAIKNLKLSNPDSSAEIDTLSTYVRAGVHEAAARYESPRQLTELFCSVTYAVDGLLISPDEGDTLTVTVDFDKRTAEAKHVSMYDTFAEDEDEG